jgi:hypothetical protein
VWRIAASWRSFCWFLAIVLENVIINFLLAIVIHVLQLPAARFDDIDRSDDALGVLVVFAEEHLRWVVVGEAVELTLFRL